ncbi:MAG: ABC transporter permease [Bacteroidetes bacterium]|nr:ABC transporter permease [Bacteroidota bacterium]
MLFIRLLRESYLFALNAIIVNKLRTILSLLGITIGIFAIISVFTIVDSMKTSIQTSIESLGNNVLYVQKWPWSFGSDYPWWKYMNRPVPSLEDLDEIQKRSSYTDVAVFMINTSKTVEYQNNSLENAAVVAATQDFDKVSAFELSEGRYFSNSESNGGKPVAIIGSDIAENLFPNMDPLDKDIKMFGRKLNVVGVFKKEGSNFFGNSSDNQVLVPLSYARNVIDIKFEGFDPMIMVRAKKGISNEELKDELTGIMRSIRKLKPAADDDFALNETSLLSKGFEELFGVIALAGWIIGGFSILVGGFGIANIMFVSVKERTSIIGIQKSLGAKNYFILFEFLFESIILCLFGGALGLFIVYMGTVVVSSMLDMDLVLTQGNILLGLFVSAIIGLVSGFIPAYSASRLDPVEAIRAN